MRYSDETSGKRGTSPDKGKGLGSDVSLKRCTLSTLEPRVRWMRREGDTKEAKLSLVPFRRPSFGRSRGTFSLRNMHALHPQHVFPEERRIQERISGSCLLAFFLTRIVYLYRRGEHEEQEPGTVPLKCRANGRE